MDSGNNQVEISSSILCTYRTKKLINEGLPSLLNWSTTWFTPHFLIHTPATAKLLVIGFFLSVVSVISKND